MGNRTLLLSTLTAVALLGCKEKSGETEPQELAGDETGETGTSTSGQEVLPATDAQVIATLREEATTIFSAATNDPQPLHWNIKGELIALRVAASEKKSASATYDATIYALVGPAEEEKKFFACKGLKASANGRIDAVLRGDMLHILCITPPQADDPGQTDAGRFDFDLSTRSIAPKGSYGGDGTLDLDTIDLDEGE